MTQLINTENNNYNNAYHEIIEVKPVYVKPRIYIDFKKENNKEGLKFKVGDHVRTSKYKNTFCKRLCSKFEFFYDKEMKRTIQNDFRVEKSNNEKRQ